MTMPKGKPEFDAAGMAMMQRMFRLHTGIQKILGEHGVPEDKRPQCAEEIVMLLMATVSEMAGE